MRWPHEAVPEKPSQFLKFGFERNAWSLTAKPSAIDLRYFSLISSIMLLFGIDTRLDISDIFITLHRNQSIAESAYGQV